MLTDPDNPEIQQYPKKQQAVIQCTQMALSLRLRKVGIPEILACPAILLYLVNLTLPDYVATMDD